MHRLLLIEALNCIALSGEAKPLSSVGFRHSQHEAEHERINAIYDTAKNISAGPFRCKRSPS